MTKRLHLAAILLLALPLWAGCASEPASPFTPIDSSSNLLREADSCEDLLGGIQADALVKVDIEAQSLIAQRGGPSLDMSEGGAAAPNADGGSRGPSEPEGPSEWSETNTQVEGVDEADIVKTDGTHLYVLSRGELLVMRSWPPGETEMQVRYPMEGYPIEMFVADGRAIVFSRTGDPSATDETCSGDWGYRYGWYPCYSHSFTKVTVVDLAETQVVRELYFEGSYRSARRHDDQVRAVMQSWGSRYRAQIPSVWEFLYPYDPVTGRSYGPADDAEYRERVLQWRDAARAAILASDLDDWLPRRFERVAGELTALAPSCDQFYVTAPGLSDYGMTQIAGFDLSDAQSRVTQSGVWGYAREIYANHQAFVLAMVDYSAYYRAYQNGAATYRDHTLLHRFGFAPGGDLAYEASGWVPGRIHDQFSIDERGGILRLATTQTTHRIYRGDWREWDWEPPTTHNYVTTLRTEGRRLLEHGRTPPLAEGERVFSSRFLGDTAYVVTFRQVDPLFAIDLTDDANPTVLGELKIPGFSDYMHPLDEGHLLTIGRDATEDGRVRGLALQIFDVRDRTSPRLVHRQLFEDRYGYSEANWEHKAFTFFDSRGLLAFPYASWGSDWNDYRSSLEVFRVDATEGFESVASIDHTPLLQRLCGEPPPGAEERRDAEWWQWYSCRSYGVNVRRGVFIDDYVYSLSYGGVRVHEILTDGTGGPEGQVRPVTDVAF